MTQKHSWDMIQVKSATASGFETATEGDSINLSVPDSKTRRGRVGNQQAQTIDTGANQAVVVKELENKFRVHKTDDKKSGVQGGDVFKQSAHTMDIIDNHPKNIQVKYGEEVKRNTDFILSKLRKEVGEEKITEWGFRLLNTLQEKKILRPEMYGRSVYKKGEEGESWMVNSSLSFEEAEKELLRIMWQQNEFGCSPHKWKLAGQFFKEFTNTLQGLSHKISPQKTDLLDLPRETLLERILHETLSDMVQIRESIDDKSEPIYTTNIRRLTEIEVEILQGFYPNHTKYGNYDGVVKEVSKTQRYKQCGNAVTVDVVEMIGKKLLQTLTQTR